MRRFLSWTRTGILVFVFLSVLSMVYQKGKRSGYGQGIEHGQRQATGCFYAGTL